VLVGDDPPLRRAGDAVDAHRAEHEALGGGDVGVAGPDDLGDGRDGLRAVRERRHGLGAADAIDLLDAGQLGRGQHQRIQLAVGRGHHHDDARHAGDLGGDGVHEHGAGIGGQAPRHIEPDGFDRRPAPAELDAHLIGVALVHRQLAGVVLGNTVGRDLQSVQCLGAAGFARGAYLRRADAQSELAEVDAIELLRQVDERRIAARAHVGNDRRDGGADIVGGFALFAEEGDERRLEAGIARLQALGHLAIGLAAVS